MCASSSASKASRNTIMCLRRSTFWDQKSRFEIALSSRHVSPRHSTLFKRTRKRGAISSPTFSRAQTFFLKLTSAELMLFPKKSHAQDHDAFFSAFKTERKEWSCLPVSPVRKERSLKVDVRCPGYWGNRLIKCRCGLCWILRRATMPAYLSLSLLENKYALWIKTQIVSFYVELVRGRVHKYLYRLVV